MPGEMQLVEGKVEREGVLQAASRVRVVFDVEGLQEALEKWVGREVSISIEDVTK